MVSRSLLGPAIPGAEVAWRVNAYDKDDIIISSNSGIINSEPSIFFKMADCPLPKADKLLLERQWDEAIAAYEAILEKTRITPGP